MATSNTNTKPLFSSNDIDAWAERIDLYLASIRTSDDSLGIRVDELGSTLADNYAPVRRSFSPAVCS